VNIKEKQQSPMASVTESETYVTSQVIVASCLGAELGVYRINIIT